MSYLEKKIERLGFKITFNPPGDGDCYFGSSGQQLHCRSARNRKPELWRVKF